MLTGLALVRRLSLSTNETGITAMNSTTFADFTTPANWTMTVERKETKSGNVSFIHTVFFKGDVYDTRKSKREYRAFWLDVAKGVLHKRGARGLAHNLKTAKEYRAKAAAGGISPFPGCVHTPDMFLEWAAGCDRQAERTREALARIEAAGVAYDWDVIDSGFCGRPDLAKGNILVVSKHQTEAR